MPVNDATLDLITEFEGFVDHWYPDVVHGWSVPTCMYGHTNATGNPPTYSSTADRKLVFTKDHGIETLKLDLERYEKAVDMAVTVPLNDNQRGALVSFTYNLGEGNLRKSTLLKKLNAGDYKNAADQILLWDRAGGKKLNGLTRRREAERSLFLSPSAASPESSNPVSGTMPTVTAPNWFVALIQFILSLFKRG